jgi:hypothetical protein
MFNRQFTCTWRRLSDLLGFDSDCVLDFNVALPDFQKEQFWKEILIKIFAIDLEIVIFNCRPSILFIDLFPQLYSLDLKPRPSGKTS